MIKYLQYIKSSLHKELIENRNLSHLVLNTPAPNHDSSTHGNTF